MSRCRRFAMGLWCAVAPFAAQEPPDPTVAFVKIDTMIPMPDGVRLHTRLFVPKADHAPLPFILERTPYGIDAYIFVFQDIRGRFKSQGQFVMQRPPREPSDARAIDETTDAYDTIDYRIMVQVQSTWLPIIDRNPRTYVPNIFLAKDSDYRKAAHRIYRSARYPSHVTLPIAAP